MSEPSPPRDLPSAFLEIWHMLARADAHSPSRRALATRLGVSTHTLQRILVDGEVPDFSTTRNTRIVRSWARLLTRLATRFDREPRDWIELVGIPWDRGIESAVRSALETSATRTAADTARGTSTAGADAATVQLEWPDVMRCGIAGDEAVTGSDRDAGERFLVTLLHRLMGTVAPLSKLRPTTMQEHELVAELSRPDPTIDLAIGVLDTVPRRQHGLTLVSIPGWRVRLGTVGIRAARGASSMPGWWEAVRPERPTELVFLVLEGGVAQRYLQGTCSVPPAQLLVRHLAGTDDVPAAMLRELDRRPDRPVIFVDEANTCDRTRQILEVTEGAGEHFVVETPDGAPAECPSYPAALALGPHLADMGSLLARAMDQELCDSCCEDTARLYATHLAGRRTTGWRLADHGRPPLSAGFRTAVCRHLIEAMESRLMIEWQELGIPGELDAQRLRAMAVAPDRARTLLPLAWHSLLDTVSAERQRAHATAPIAVAHCQSCSVSLTDTGHRGQSEHYCRFCADDTGKLRPRREVQQLIAQWMSEWQGQMPRTEAMRRAGLFMQAMPAWSRN